MAAEKTSKSTPSKSDFIRKHANLSAANVIAAGKAAGIKFSSQLVYNVRGGSKTKKTASTRKTAAKKAARSTKPATTSKADFVRARSHLSAKEVVADAKAAGLKLDANYIYKVRGRTTVPSKKASGSTKSPAPKKTATSKLVTTSKPSAANGSHRSTSSVEDLLRAAAAELGLGRGIEILQGERARVRAVIGR